MNKAFLRALLKVLCVAGDAAAFSAAFAAAYYARFHAGLIPAPHGIPAVEYYVYAAPFFLTAFLLSLNYAGLYREGARLSGFSVILKVFSAVSAGTIVILSASFFIRIFSYSRAAMVFMWGFSFLFVAVWRLIYRVVEKFFNRMEFDVKRIIVAGATDVTRMLIERLKRESGAGYRIIGCVDNSVKKGKKFAGVPVLGKIKGLNVIIKREKADEVFIGLDDYRRKEVADIIMKNDRTKFMIASDILGLITKSIDYDEILGIPVFSVRELFLNKKRNRVVKRAFDIISSAAGLIVLSPLFLIAAAAIRAESKGGVFYKQERMGRDNRVFMIYKFRTMRIDAEDKTGPVWAKEHDPRRTSVGAFLRKTSIDELPQLINVFKGEMSVVGPRPERPHFVNKFKKEIPRYIERHKVKSGITGWAQVHGLRGNTSIAERVKYDIYYIENWSILLDIKIIIKTVLEVFHHNTAY